MLCLAFLTSVVVTHPQVRSLKEKAGGHTMAVCSPWILRGKRRW